MCNFDKHFQSNLIIYWLIEFIFTAYQYFTSYLQLEIIFEP